VTDTPENPTPAPAPTPAPTPAPVATVKPWYAQISNYVGAFIGIVGNALPYITPDFLESIGVTATAAHTISSIVAVILVAYKEKATTPGVPAK
jgi:hypothetical protein